MKTKRRKRIVTRAFKKFSKKICLMEGYIDGDDAGKIVKAKQLVDKLADETDIDKLSELERQIIINLRNIEFVPSEFEDFRYIKNILDKIIEYDSKTAKNLDRIKVNDELDILAGKLGLSNEVHRRYSK